MTSYLIAGGWGYNNLGDEAILAGYLNFLAPQGKVLVSSVDPVRTQSAQGVALDINYAREGKVKLPPSATAILGGGGYLNGAWQPEISLKLGRLRRDIGDAQLLVHSVEARGLDRRLTGTRIRALLDSAVVSVRDVESQQVIGKLGFRVPEVVPDAISLLYPHLDAYVETSRNLEGKVLLNLLNISERGDSAESEVPPANWIQFCDDLVAALGDRAVGLVVGGGDFRFMQRWPNLPLIEPTTVTGLLSSLASASAVLSVRMHPALISTMLGKPTVSVPYCGKVRPTLSQIGVDSAVMRSLDLASVLDSLELAVDHSSSWTSAHDSTVNWLQGAIRARQP